MTKQVGNYYYRRNSLGDGGEGVTSEASGKYGVQERVGARVDGVEEDEQYFGVGDVDERVAEQRGEAEEYHGRRAHEVGADQHEYLAGHRRLALGRVPGLVAQRRVDLHVAEQHQQERAGPEQQQREHVAHGDDAGRVHGQTYAVRGGATEKQ